MQCVRLRDSLSNPNKQLRRLLAALENSGGLANLQVSEDAVAELVAQTGAEDPASVRLAIKENRKLSPTEIDGLVERYEAGATIRSLSQSFGLHEQTARAHLRRRGVKLRSLCALTDEQEVEVVRLYVEEVWSLNELGTRFGVDPSSIRRALLRRGVKRRPPRRR